MKDEGSVSVLQNVRDISVYTFLNFSHILYLPASHNSLVIAGFSAGVRVLFKYKVVQI